MTSDTTKGQCYYGYPMFILWGVLFVVLSACKEVGPDINLHDQVNDTTLRDTTYMINVLPQPQLRNVLLEEFTGVRCINCPDGHEQIKNILYAHQGRVIAVSLHSEFLGVAYPGQPELRIPEAQDLEELLGPAAAKPMASIDRVLFSGETSILQFIPQWSGRVAERVQVSVLVNVEIENQLFGADLISRITITCLQNLVGTYRLTVLLTEDSIRAAQLTSSGVDSSYVHHHVARAFMTRYNGIPLDYPFESGRVIVKELRFSHLREQWNHHALTVVGLVHEYGSSMRVLQAASRKVYD